MGLNDVVGAIEARKDEEEEEEEDDDDMECKDMAVWQNSQEQEYMVGQRMAEREWEEEELEKVRPSAREWSPMAPTPLVVIHYPSGRVTINIFIRPQSLHMHLSY